MWQSGKSARPAIRRPLVRDPPLAPPLTAQAAIFSSVCPII